MWNNLRCFKTSTHFQTSINKNFFKIVVYSLFIFSNNNKRTTLIFETYSLIKNVYVFKIKYLKGRKYFTERGRKINSKLQLSNIGLTVKMLYKKFHKVFILEFIFDIS